MSFIVLGAVLLGALVQGCTGFGFGLVGVPLMLMALPSAMVVPIMVLLSVGLNLMVWRDARKDASIREIWPLLVGGVAGIPLGVWLLLWLPPFWFGILVGFTVCLVALLLARGKTFDVGSGPAVLFPVGIVSGILNGSLSLSGPPVVLFLAGKGTGKNRFRASLSTYFLLLNVFSVTYFAWRGLFSLPVLKLTLSLLPVLVGGTVGGILISRGLREKAFRRVVISLVLLSGLLQVWSVLRG